MPQIQGKQKKRIPDTKKQKNRTKPFSFLVQFPFCQKHTNCSQFLESKTIKKMALQSREISGIEENLLNWKKVYGYTSFCKRLENIFEDVSFKKF